MVFTPRWDSAGNYTTHAAGQTVSVYQDPVGDLPNAFLHLSLLGQCTGPPLDPDLLTARLPLAHGPQASLDSASRTGPSEARRRRRP